MKRYGTRRCGLVLFSIASLVAVLVGSGERCLRAQEPRVLKGHDAWAHSIAFSPDGKTLASGDTEGTVRLWDVSTGKMLRELIPYDIIPVNMPTTGIHSKGHINHMRFSADSKTLIVLLWSF